MKKDKVVFHDINNKETEISVEKIIWRPSAYGILIEDSKILLSKQWDGYDFPGGGLDVWETVEEGLVREFKEEIGVLVEAGQIVHAETSFFIPPHGSGYYNCVLLYFICQKTGGELSIDGFDEHEKGYADMPEWVDISEIEKIKFINSVDSVVIIKKALNFFKK